MSTVTVTSQSAPEQVFGLAPLSFPFLFWLSFDSSFLRSHFQPFSDVPSENFVPRYKKMATTLLF
jgi:hypothetical protein